MSRSPAMTRFTIRYLAVNAEGSRTARVDLTSVDIESVKAEFELWTLASFPSETCTVLDVEVFA